MREFLKSAIIFLFLVQFASSQLGLRLRNFKRLKDNQSGRVRDDLKDESSNSTRFRKASVRQRLIALLEEQKSSYDVSLRPETENLTVSLNVAVYCIYGLDDKELLEFSGWFGLSWTDHRFVWNPKEWDNIDTIEMSTTNVWMPDVGIWNVKEPENADLRSRGSRTVVIKPNGTLFSYFPYLANIPCPIKTMYFPFDKQSCRVIIGTVNSPNTYYKLILNRVNFEYSMKFLVGEWKPVTYNVKTESVYNPDHHLYYDQINLDIVLSRKTLYHIVLVIIPFGLLTLIALVMFLTPEAGDRVNISIAIILAMTIYVMITSQNAPKSMTHVPLLGTYLMLQMLMLILFTFISLVSAISPKMSADEQRDKRFWGFLKDHRAVIDFIGSLLYLTCTVVNSVVCLLIVPHHTDQ